MRMNNRFPCVSIRVVVKYYSPNHVSQGRPPTQTNPPILYQPPIPFSANPLLFIELLSKFGPFA
jgi:hypothetical protein